MAIPTKRYERSIVCYLNHAEITTLLAAPDQATWLGRRDHALLALMIQTGVRVSELVGLRVRDVQLGTGRHVRVLGKGRKRRATPLTGEVATLLRMDHRTRRRTRRPTLPDTPGRTAESLYRRAAHRQVRRHRGVRLPVAEGQTRHTPRAASHRGHGLAGKGR
jgi:integrase/recombinase XerD